MGTVATFRIVKVMNHDFSFSQLTSFDGNWNEGLTHLISVLLCICFADADRKSAAKERKGRR